MPPDTQSLYSPAWRRFVCFDGQGLTLVDRKRVSSKHREHSPAKGRYTVVIFDADQATVRDCDICGERLALLEGVGECVVLLSTDDADEAERTFAAAEQTLVRGLPARAPTRSS